MQKKIITTTALLFAGALLFTGCATSTTDGASGDDNCEVVRVAVRDISNGAQNAIATAADQSLTETLEGYSKRLDELAADNADNADLTKAIEGVQEKVVAAEDYAATLPAEATEDFTPDADAQATASGDIQAAAVTVTEVCK
ncbi:hypothetical protein SAMN05428970_0500 [Agromyces sp. CF514]|uniref:hypothetical protein n=1 Tax=Agromyces sp. CF514 TaxID=1881031 RepID=UPI0008E1D3FF|nr:hypothetical protein [Agromyces sp. CF514]SFR68733.1 hypothetical protein SAMN05428970_0500 [Agromyces sp. CF514]